MVEVQCPHCVDDVELENDAFGLFECPYCDEEFEYYHESSNDLSTIQTLPETNSNVTFNIGIGFLFVSIIIVILGFMSISSVPDDLENTSRECDEMLWFDNWYEDRGCSTEGDYGAGSLCGGIFMIIIGFAFGIAAIISLVIGSVNGSKKVTLVQEK